MFLLICTDGMLRAIKHYSRYSGIHTRPTILTSATACRSTECASPLRPRPAFHPQMDSIASLRVLHHHPSPPPALVSTSSVDLDTDIAPASCGSNHRFTRLRAVYMYRGERWKRHSAWIAALWRSHLPASDSASASFVPHRYFILTRTHANTLWTVSSICASSSLPSPSSCGPACLHGAPPPRLASSVVHPLSAHTSSPRTGISRLLTAPTPLASPGASRFRPAPAVRRAGTPIGNRHENAGAGCGMRIWTTRVRTHRREMRVESGGSQQGGRA
ncbi:hypothetical protein B0H11DRAFT_168279 [Mycena galericulata]|nr:hypothetical protein B0H11DRAFT_168279 [Mycena galericulata]